MATIAAKADDGAGKKAILAIMANDLLKRRSQECKDPVSIVQKAGAPNERACK